MLRQKYILMRKSLTPEDVYTKSERVFENFVACNFEKAIKKVLVYLPIKNEVDIKSTIKHLKQSSVELFLPAHKNGEWVVSKFENEDGLVNGPYETWQPAVLKAVEIDDLDMTIVPGVAFSKSGVRLGYGKGVYDKLLKGFGGIKIGLAYDFQIIDTLPFFDHDVKMDYLISESRTIRVSG